MEGRSAVAVYDTYVPKIPSPTCMVSPLVVRVWVSRLTVTSQNISRSVAGRRRALDRAAGPAYPAEVTDPDASLRVSDAERDTTLRVLGDHAAVGRLTLDELEERSGRALTAKTRGELATLVRDLPQDAGQEPPAPPLAKKPAPRHAALTAVTTP